MKALHFLKNLPIFFAMFIFGMFIVSISIVIMFTNPLLLKISHLNQFIKVILIIQNIFVLMKFKTNNFKFFKNMHW